MTSLPSRPPAAPEAAAFPALLYGMLLVFCGLALYAAGVLVGAVEFLAGVSNPVYSFAQRLMAYGGVPILAGSLLVILDLAVLLPRKRTRTEVLWDPPSNDNVTVVLTAYNDEASIGFAVKDFLPHPKVRRVIVVDNNSKDRTSAVAREAGAIVVVESRPGYGNCVWRALHEGLACRDTELTLLCEGDMTFRAHDINKFLAYVPHAEIVNGTRIVEQLRARETQLTTFMYYGNFFAGKLLEAKHLGRGTFTDVGTTYKLCRNTALGRLLPLVNPEINLEFNAHFLDTALKHGFGIVECPITFHNRYGVSKGGNVSDTRALKVGLKMLWGVVAGWKKR